MGVEFWLLERRGLFSRLPSGRERDPLNPPADTMTAAPRLRR